MPKPIDKCRDLLRRIPWRKAGAAVRRSWGMACHGCGVVKRRLVPAEGLAPEDMALLRWVSLCAAVLVPVGVLYVSGALEAVDEWQVQFLLGRPFYMDAQDVGVSLLGRAGMFALCTLYTLYMAWVLLREKRWERRAQMSALALVAMALPGLLCVLWHGMLYMAPAVLCVVLLWLLTLVPFFRTPRDAA